MTYYHQQFQQTKKVNFKYIVSIEERDNISQKHKKRLIVQDEF